MTSGKHILIVDDYPDALEIWALFLRSMGYRVSTATDGAAALAQAQELLPDLIVLDLELPRISGFDVARQLRANPDTESIPLIAATGYSHTRQLDHAREIGFDQIVIKPCDPDTLIEAEFFGHGRGAFTDAREARAGLIAQAHGGTLFLDEVGELPASMQAKLLRALQEQCFFRLGSERVTRSDFRVIAASNRDLYADMNAGRFREDLFYRLAVIRITLAPLRERPEDIRWLTEKLLGQIAIEQARPLAMSEKFSRDVLGRNWRGNVRELRSYLEQAVVMSEAGILDEPLPDTAPADQIANPFNEALEVIAPLQTMVEDAERTHIRRALTRCEGSISKTAELLGVSRKTLWEKMKRLAVAA